MVEFADPPARRRRRALATAAPLAIALLLGGQAPAAAEDAYRIHLGDRLQIDVYKNEQVSGQAQVAADGTIALALVGRVKAAGRTLVGLEGEIRKTLAEVHHFQDPVVVARVTDYAPVFVSGWVRTPGRYTFSPGLTVRQALVLGGGLGPPQNATADTGQATLTQINAVKTIRMMSRVRLHMLVRLARLTAEQSGAEAFDLPPQLDGADPAELKDLVEGERAILAARRRSLDDSLEAMTRQQADLTAEVEALKAREAAIKSGIGSYKEELKDAESLREKGFTSKIRVMEIERGIFQLYGEMHETTASTLSAKVALGAVARERIAKIANAREKTEEERLATVRQLEEAEAAIAASQSEIARFATDVAAGDRAAALTPHYMLYRRTGGSEEAIPAREETALLPGDTLEAFVTPAALAAAPAPPAATAATAD